MESKPLFTNLLVESATFEKRVNCCLASAKVAEHLHRIDGAASAQQFMTEMISIGSS
jgi:hypothetical protein